MGRDDCKLRQDWEVHSANIEFPSLEDVLQCIKMRRQALELPDIHISDNERHSRGNYAETSSFTKGKPHVANLSTSTRGSFCNAGH